MPKDGNTSSNFNGEVILPKKLELRFKKLILRHGRLFEDFIPNNIHNANHDKLYQFFKFSNIHNIASRQFEDTKVLQARLDIADMNKREHKLCDDMVDLIYNRMIDFFSDLSINESMILSQRARKDRVKKIRNGDAKPFQDISLQPYVSHFVRWLCNSELPPHQYISTAVGWLPEDWDSDAISVIRGYLISKNQNQGKAQFRLEDFDYIENQSHLGEPKVDEGVKPKAAGFIPAEGADYVRLALSTMPTINQEKLPDIWKTDEFSPVSLPQNIIDPPRCRYITRR